MEFLSPPLDLYRTTRPWAQVTGLGKLILSHASATGIAYVLKHRDLSCFVIIIIIIICFVDHLRSKVNEKKSIRTARHGFMMFMYALSIVRLGK